MGQETAQAAKMPQQKDRRSQWRQKVIEHLKRYAPMEAFGILTAALCAIVAFIVTDKSAVITLAAAVGENIGFYGFGFLRELDQCDRRVNADGQRRTKREVFREVARNMTVEFLGAEIVDTGSRWIIMMVCKLIMPVGWAIVAGKVIADIIFLILAGQGYELRKKLWKDD